MNRQRGVSLSGMLFWSVVVALVASVVLKVMPSAIEYYSILKNVNIVAASSSGMTVAEIRKSYERNAYMNNIKDITPADLEISKDGSSVVISFAYEKRIPLFANVSLLIDYQGSSSGR